MAPQAVEERLGDTEIVFRRVLPGKQHWKRYPNGVRVSGQAFTDRNMEPSVDRALVLEQMGRGPEHTQETEENGVLWLNVGAVRSIALTTNDDRGRPVSEQAGDVVPRTEQGEAHCVILLVPGHATGSVFKRFVERLAIQANKQWKIYPKELRDVASPAP